MWILSRCIFTPQLPPERATKMSVFLRSCLPRSFKLEPLTNLSSLFIWLQLKRTRGKKKNKRSFLFCALPPQRAAAAAQQNPHCGTQFHTRNKYYFSSCLKYCSRLMNPCHYWIDSIVSRAMVHFRGGFFLSLSLSRNLLLLLLSLSSSLSFGLCWNWRNLAERLAATTQLLNAMKVFR